MKIQAMKICHMCNGLHPAKESEHIPIPSDMGRVICNLCKKKLNQVLTHNLKKKKELNNGHK